MSFSVYQFDNVGVKIDGDVQKLVQKVSVKADTGLEFVTLPDSGIQEVYSKNKNITIDIEYLHDGTFIDPTIPPLSDSLGFINITRSGVQDIRFSGCVLVGTASRIDANSNSWGTKTYTYMALSYDHIASTFTKTTPATGDAGASRACYPDALEDPQISFESSCSIDRELVYSPTKKRPSHIIIKYPIVSTSSVSFYETGVSLRETGTLNCDTQQPSAVDAAGIPNAYLENISVEGATVDGDVKIITYSYKSTQITGELTRIIDVT